MATSQPFSIKFTSEGLPQVRRDADKARKSFTDWLEASDRAFNEANEVLNSFNATQSEIAEAEKRRANATKTRNQTIQNSYRELGVKSTASIQDLKKQAISAYDAIAASGEESTEGLARASQALQKRLAQLDAQLNDTEKELKDVDQAADQAGGGFTILKGAVAGFLANLATQGFSIMVGGLQNLFGQSVATRTELSRLRDQLTLLEGGELQGEAAFNRISKFAATTPFEINEVTSAFVKLGNRGIKPTNEQLIAIGDLALSQNKSLDQLVEAILDAQTGENERLKEFGIRGEKSGDQVRLSFKGVTEEVQLTEQAVLDAIVGFGRVEGVSGSIEKAANRLDGVGSNVSDGFTRIFDTIGGILEPILISGGKALAELLGPLSDPTIFAPLGDALNELISALTGVLPNTESLTDLIVNGLRDGIIVVAGFVREIAEIIRENPALIENALESLKATAVVLGTIVTAVGLAALGWVRFQAAIVSAGDVLRDTLFSAIGEIPQAFEAAIGGIQALWGALLQEIQQQIIGLRIFWLRLQDSVEEVWANIREAATVVIQFLRAAVSNYIDNWVNLGQVVAGVWQTIRQTAGRVLAQIVEALRPVMQAWQSLREFVIDLWGRISQVAIAALKRVFDAVEDIVTPFKEIFDFGVKIGKSILGWIKPLTDALSPLKQFQKLLGNIFGKTEKTGTDVAARLESRATSTGEGGPLLPGNGQSFHPRRFPVTSHFGQRNGRLHAGTDYGTPQGTQLENIWGPGIVTIAGQVGAYGGLVELTLQNGDVYRFGHLSQINVRQGQPVGAGAILGLTGGAPGTQGAGRSTGPHLHLERYPGGGGPIDPHAALGSGGPNFADMRPANNIRKFSSTGRGGPKEEKLRKKKDAKKAKLNKIKTQLTTILEDTTKVVADQTTDFTEIEQVENDVKAKFDRVFAKIDKSKAKIQEFIEFKKQEKIAFDDEASALKELAKLRKTATQAQDEEIKKSKEAFGIRKEAQRELDRVSRGRELTDLDIQIAGARSDNLERRGGANEFDLQRSRIQSQIVQTQAEFAERLANLGLERAQTDVPEQIQHIDQLIARYKELESVTLDGLRGQIDEVTKAQAEANRVLPNAREITEVAIQGAQQFLGSIGDIITGSRDLGEALRDIVGSILNNLAQLFSSRAFSALEGILFGGNRQGGGGGGGGLFGSLLGSAVGAISGGFGGGGGGGPSALNFDAAPIFAARGGLIRGPGTGTSDSIPSMLSNREFVVNADSVGAVGVSNLDFINQNGQLPPSSNSTRSQVVNFNISTPDAGGFAKTERQSRSAMVAELQKFR